MCILNLGDKMIVTMDIGNTNTSVVVYDKDQEVDFFTFVTPKEDINYNFKKEIIERCSDDVEAILISNVVPRIQEELEPVIEEIYQKKPIFVNAEMIEGFVNKLDNPLELGADLLVTSIAAYEIYKAPVIVVDIGSASKIALTGRNGDFEGGIILPGLKTSLESLYSYIPHLPQIDYEIPKQVIGKSTVECIQSGVFYGLISQVEGLSYKMEKEYGEECIPVLTGGYSNIIKEHLPNFVFIPHLVNEGLRIVYEKSMFK